MTDLFDIVLNYDQFLLYNWLYNWYGPYRMGGRSFHPYRMGGNFERSLAVGVVTSVVV